MLNAPAQISYDIFVSENGSNESLSEKHTDLAAPLDFGDVAELFHSSSFSSLSSLESKRQQ